MLQNCGNIYIFQIMFASGDDLNYQGKMSQKHNRFQISLKYKIFVKHSITKIKES